MSPHGPLAVWLAARGVADAARDVAEAANAAYWCRDPDAKAFLLGNARAEVTRLRTHLAGLEATLASKEPAPCS
jgi:hypothetical protein